MNWTVVPSGTTEVNELKDGFLRLKTFIAAENGDNSIFATFAACDCSSCHGAAALNNSKIPGLLSAGLLWPSPAQSFAVPRNVVNILIYDAISVINNK